MLARVYVEHDKWEEAAAVYNALASRTSNYNEPSVNLNTRLDLFRMAKLQVSIALSVDLSVVNSVTYQLHWSAQASALHPQQSHTDLSHFSLYVTSTAFNKHETPLYAALLSAV